MTNEEKKRYILQNWTTSSGKRIAEMLKRYFSQLPKEEEVDTSHLISQIFLNQNEEKNGQKN